MTPASAAQARRQHAELRRDVRKHKGRARWHRGKSREKAVALAQLEDWCREHGIKIENHTERLNRDGTNSTHR